MNTIKHLVTKAKLLLHQESKLEPEERAQHQWQMLTKRSGVQYIVGKGGANTCFIVIGEGERKLYYPDEFIKQLEKLAKQKFGAYAIYCKRRDKLYPTRWHTIDEVKAREPRRSSLVIVGLDDKGNRHELYYASKGLTGISWVRI